MTTRTATSDPLPTGGSPPPVLTRPWSPHFCRRSPARNLRGSRCGDDRDGGRGVERARVPSAALCGSLVLHIVGGRVVVAAELNAGALARRLRTALGEIYGHLSDGHLLTPREIAHPSPLSGASGHRRAVAAATRANRALHILGDRAPDHLAAAGALRCTTGTPRCRSWAASLIHR